jgi:hypothetical protein
VRYLKAKLDAGADFVVTQLFYEADRYIQFVKDCRSVGITAPILPGIMPIMAYGGFKRMTGFCKTAVPAWVAERMEALKDDDEAVKKFGVQLGVEICRKLLDAGTPGGWRRPRRGPSWVASASGSAAWRPDPQQPRACPPHPARPPPPGLHMYSLNLERSVVGILEGVGLLDTAKVPRTLPWRHVPGGGQRAQEVRRRGRRVCGVKGGGGRRVRVFGCRPGQAVSARPGRSRASLPQPAANCSAGPAPPVAERPLLPPPSPPQGVRPIFWSNRPKAYITRTANWDAFPNGERCQRWDSTHPGPAAS